MKRHHAAGTAGENSPTSEKTAQKIASVRRKRVNPAKSRLEVRITPDDKDLIEQAAFVLRETTTTFVLQAARSAAQEVLRREQLTVVSPDFYDKIIASLDAPPVRNSALTEAARKNSDIMDR
ncbi:DUF1778 domain-containing protein [Microbispora rosea]|uniref:type II toxin-antitoxin system TacA family antitoxin n=1 Tax=Microbispora rosea TaxID=58117 RepID=UPI003D8D1103